MKLSIDDLDQLFGWATVSTEHGQGPRGDLIVRLRRLRERLEHPEQPQSESAPSGDPVDGNDVGLPDRDQSGRRGASQPVDEREWSRVFHALMGYEYQAVLRSEAESRLIAAEQRAEQARRAAEFRWKKMRDRITELEQEAAAAEQRAKNAEQLNRDFAHTKKRENEERFAEREATAEQLRTAEQRAKIARGNTKREYDRAAQLVHQVKAAKAENADLRDALRGLYNALDRYGWCTGRSMESRDTLLAKARAALKEERPA